MTILVIQVWIIRSSYISIYFGIYSCGIVVCKNLNSVNTFHLNSIESASQPRAIEILLANKAGTKTI